MNSPIPQETGPSPWYYPPTSHLRLTSNNTQISVKDVGAWAAQTLLDPSPKPAFWETKLYGPRSVTPNELKAAFEEVLGKKGEMTLVPPEKLREFWAALLPEKYVDEFVDFTTAQLEGGVLLPEYPVDEGTIVMKRELIEDLRDMAA